VYQIVFDAHPPNFVLSMKNCKLGLAFFICLLWAQYSNGQFRKYSNEFLNIGAGAKGLSMGGAMVAGAGDATAGYWNPAGLTSVKEQPSLSLMHAEYFAGIGKYDFAAIAIPLASQSGKAKTLGLSLLRFAVDDIPNTLYLIEPNGSINYNNITSFSSADYAFLISYAQEIFSEGDRQLSFGASTKVIHRNVGSFAMAWGIGLDAGITYESAAWDLGIVARDITTTFNIWNFRFTDREKQVLYLTNNEIPVRSTELTAPRLNMGVAYKKKVSSSIKMRGELNLDLTFDGKRNVLLSSQVLSVDPRLGLEAEYRNIVYGRLGVYNFQRGLKDGDTTNLQKTWIFQPGIGVGFKLKQVTIDYAFTNLANQSNPLYTHVFSLSLNLVRKENSN
jgi:hypothetical protein